MGNYIFDIDVLKQYMAFHHLSLQECADRIGISKTTLYRWTSHTRIPDLYDLIRICNVLHISTGDFIHHSAVRAAYSPFYGVWREIKIYPKKIETLRRSKGLTKTALVNNAMNDSGIRTTLTAYHRFLCGENSDMRFVTGLINVTDCPLADLFDDHTLESPNGQVVTLSEKLYKDMLNEINGLRDEKDRLKEICAGLPIHIEKQNPSSGNGNIADSAAAKENTPELAERISSLEQLVLSQNEMIKELLGIFKETKLHEATCGTLMVADSYPTKEEIQTNEEPGERAPMKLFKAKKK